MSTSSFLFGSGGQTKQFPLFSQNQQSAQNQILKMLPELLKGGSFEPIRKHAMTNWEENILPTLAERLGSLGQGAESTQAYKGALAQSGANLEEGLSAQESQYNLARQGQLGNLFGYGMQQPFENVSTLGGPGFLGQMAPGIGAGMGKAIPYWLTQLLAGGGKQPGKAIPTLAGQEEAPMAAPQEETMLSKALKTAGYATAGYAAGGPLGAAVSLGANLLPSALSSLVSYIMSARSGDGMSDMGSEITANLIRKYMG